MSDENVVASAKIGGKKTADHLMKQNLEALGIENLTPVTPEVISRQATINIGAIGHVAHGKSTVVRALTGVQTVRFSNEKQRNITIRLGYANAKIYRCSNPECPAPACYCSYGSGKEDEPLCERVGCGGRLKLLRHVSFVDCPGHDVLMATMLTGAAVMDAALLLIAADNPCPMPQTREHLAAVDLMQLEHIIVLQNKIDLVPMDKCRQQYQEIRNFVARTCARTAPVIPVSAQLRLNIDSLCETICNYIPIPERDFLSAPRMSIIRSFDTNKPGTAPEDISGGVAGGTLLQGVLKLGDEIEIRPGHVVKESDDTFKCYPLRSRVVSLYAEENDLQYAVPGGLIGVGTRIDPFLFRSDKLVGQVLGRRGTLPKVYSQVTIQFNLLPRLIGTVDNTAVKPLMVNELVRINIGSTTIGARVANKQSEHVADLVLTLPICAVIDEHVAISRRINSNWRLIGFGDVKSGVECPIDE